MLVNQRRVLDLCIRLVISPREFNYLRSEIKHFKIDLQRSPKLKGSNHFINLWSLVGLLDGKLTPR